MKFMIVLCALIAVAAAFPGGKTGLILDLGWKQPQVAVSKIIPAKATIKTPILIKKVDGDGWGNDGWGNDGWGNDGWGKGGLGGDDGAGWAGNGGWGDNAGKGGWGGNGGWAGNGGWGNGKLGWGGNGWN